MREQDLGISLEANGRRNLVKIAGLGSTAALAGGAATALLSAFMAPTAGASATWIVDSLGDTGVANPANCATPNSGNCRLRDAVDAAASGDTIEFAAGLSGSVNVVGTIDITKSLTIAGEGASAVSLDGQGVYRIFTICGADVVMSGLTITNSNPGDWDDGAAVSVKADSDCGGVTSNVTFDSMAFTDNSGYNGGAIGSWGNLTIRNTTVTGNSGPYGGGAVNTLGDASLTITDSTFSNNSAQVGGALYLHGSSTTILNSTFDNNSATNGDGGALWLSDPSGASANVLIANTTITGNSASGVGGAIYIGTSNTGVAVELDQVTISGNTAVGAGGGIYLAAEPTVTMSGVILSGNTGANGEDLSTEPFGQGWSDAIDSSLLGGVEAGLPYSGTGNVYSTTPMLGALANNGGPTMTMALLAGSPALNVGPDPVATFTGNQFDQRGTAFVRVYNGIADIGAFEDQPAPQPTTTTTTTTTTNDPVVPEFTG